MLIGLHALELAPKKAAGTSAGFTGLFGYLGGTASASAVVGWAAGNTKRLGRWLLRHDNWWYFSHPVNVYHHDRRR